MSEELIWVEKYRPKTLDDVINQNEIIQSLKRLIQERNVPHMLFTGPPGVGKTATALAFVMDLYKNEWRNNVLELNASVHPDTKVRLFYDDYVFETDFNELDKEFFKNDKSKYAYPINLFSQSLNSNYKIIFKRIKKISRHRVRKILKIFYEGGSIAITGSHSVMILNSLGEIVPIKASLLKQGDFLISYNDSKSLDNQYIPSNILIPYLKEFGIKEKDRINKRVALEILSDSGGVLLKKRILNLIKSNISVVRIDKIEEHDFDGYVYDFCIPDSQVFWGGNSPILLHNSDERGIDTIREKIKERFAKTLALGEIPFKIVILDESDAMTNDAQTALRRIMEIYARNIRFILTCNYSNKIIEPIQSRTVVFRFSPLSKDDIINRLIEIANKENVKYTKDGLEAIFEVSGGDMRKAINVLQSSSLLGEVNQEIVYKVAGAVKPKEIKAILDSVVKGKFSEARESVVKMLYIDGIPGSDIVYYLHREIGRLNVPEECKIRLIETLGDYEYRLMEGSNEEIQLASLIAKMILICKEYVK